MGYSDLSSITSLLPCSGFYSRFSFNFLLKEEGSSKEANEFCSDYSSRRGAMSAESSLLLFTSSPSKRG